MKPWPSWRIVRLKRWLEHLWRLSFRCGLFQSAWKGLPFVNGREVPWISHPAIEFLNAVVPRRRDIDILEYGCGASTIWWTERGNTVDSVESDWHWLHTVERKLTEITGPCGDSPWRLMSTRDMEQYCSASSFNGKLYDVIVIDGLIENDCRFKCYQAAKKLLKPDGLGIIVIDNADWLPKTREAAILENYTIPFFGYASLVPYHTLTLVVMTNIRILRQYRYCTHLNNYPHPVNGLEQELE